MGHVLFCWTYKQRCQVGIWAYEFGIQGRDWDGAINKGVLTLYVIIWRKRGKVRAQHGQTNICQGDEEEPTKEMEKEQSERKEKNQMNVMSQKQTWGKKCFEEARVVNSVRLLIVKERLRMRIGHQIQQILDVQNKSSFGGEVEART